MDLRQPKEEEIMGTTWPCFNIDSQAEYSWKKTHVVYLMGSAWCRVLWVAQTERDHYWGSLPNTIDEIEFSRKNMTKLFSCMIMLDHMLRRRDQNLLRNTQMGSSTPSAVFSRHCSFRLPLILIDDVWPDRWPVWALHIIWRYQKLYRWLDSLKRWSVLLTWYPYATRKMGKSSG